MTRVLPRTNFHRSEFVRCLADLGVLDSVEHGNAFAEKLGQWVHFADAIALSAVHGDGNAGAPKTQARAPSGEHAAARREFDRIRALLVDSITKSASLKPGRTHNALPIPQLELPMNLATAFPPYRRFYEAHQRDMEMSIQPLRFNVREALAKTSPELGKLAELDATFEKILRERESKLLSKVPTLLRSRFEKLFNAHRQKLADTGQEENTAGWTGPEGWLTRFCNDMQTLLLAEVEFRLQPTMGLIEAFRQDT